ncbi:MAG: carboxymuconolactone decarboxylase family protein [Archaeoglobaceae archaeon]|nr:carboxymuconolactone decarboxylase family protein [Archaeoglobaceae archaeon]MDW8117538.1 carboxymuconolactone decarboxylase family protein [Archaeoglobaceae archaeon]
MTEHEKVVKKIEKKMGFAPNIMKLVKELDPKSVEFYEFCDKVIQEDSVLPAKFKLMLVMAMGAQRHCKECVVSAMKGAMNRGATREEIIEVIRVIFVAGGAQAVAACREAIEVLMKK